MYNEENYKRNEENQKRIEENKKEILEEIKKLIAKWVYEEQKLKKNTF